MKPLIHMATQKSAAVTAVAWKFIGILKSAAVQPMREGTSKRGSMHSIPTCRTMGTGVGTVREEEEGNNFPCRVEYRTNRHQLAS